MKNIEKVKLNTDILIIGGGAAGCYAGIKIKEESEETEVLLAEKAHIKRSGCLGGGISALNAYLTPGVTPKDYVEYVKQDAEGLVREDLLSTMAAQFNQTAADLEDWGVPFIKDQAGNYQFKGPRGIKINGERIKPILAEKVEASGVQILNRVNITDYLVVEGQVRGAVGFSVREDKFYIILARAVICATGGASGIYKPKGNKAWYPPFNAGAGYAMGIRAGAEMTTFEMRFIALRTKNTVAPTGVLAQGFDARQINKYGEEYQQKYEKNSTPLRLYATNQEKKAGHGPCYLDVSHLDARANKQLKKSFLNMAPEILLQWINQQVEPNQQPIEITGTEPYVVGGHAQSGYWINAKRRTTLPGLYAAGDVAGGAPKKYATGCLVEGKIAGLDALKYIQHVSIKEPDFSLIKKKMQGIYQPLTRAIGFKPQELESRLQEIMDQYAGGVSVNYRLQEDDLLTARRLLKRFNQQLAQGTAETKHQLLKLQEVVDKALVAQVLVEHLLYREETRWRGYQERVDYPKRDDDRWLVFVNSVYNQQTEQLQFIERSLSQEGI